MSDETKLQTDELPEGISAAIDKLLANPQLITMVASALGGSPPKASEATPTSAKPSEDGSEEPTASASASPSPSLETILPLIGKLSNTSANSQPFRHEQLLCALKPYLNPARCQAIDGIIRISKMSAIIGQLK